MHSCFLRQFVPFWHHCLWSLYSSFEFPLKKGPENVERDELHWPRILWASGLDTSLYLEQHRSAACSFLILSPASMPLPCWALCCCFICSFLMFIDNRTQWSHLSVLPTIMVICSWCPQERVPLLAHWATAIAHWNAHLQRLYLDHLLHPLICLGFLFASVFN